MMFNERTVPFLFPMMDSIQSLLPKVLRKRGLQGKAEASYVTFKTQQWLEKALPELKGTIRSVKFAKPVLVVECTHGIAAQECRALLPALKEYAEKECGGVIIEEIRLNRSKC